MAYVVNSAIVKLYTEGLGNDKTSSFLPVMVKRNVVVGFPFSLRIEHILQHKLSKLYFLICTLYVLEYDNTSYFILVSLQCRQSITYYT